MRGPSAAPRIEPAVHVATHRYGSHPSQFGELVLPAPAAEGPFPVAVVLHGGFWRAAYGRQLMRGLCVDLAARGWAAWNLEYRRLGWVPRRAGGGWPATFLDVAAGIDRLGSLIEEGEPLDLRRVVAVGHSAGGHLALWAAARRTLPPGVPGADPHVVVTHAVAQAGVSDLVAAARLGLSSGVARRLLGGSPRRWPDRYGLASPAARLPLGIPQLLVHGTRDAIVPAQMSRDYRRAATVAGDPVELAELEGVGHFEHIDPESAAWAVARDWIEEQR